MEGRLTQTSQELRDLEEKIRLEDERTISETIETLCLLQNYSNTYQSLLSGAGIDFVTGLDDSIIIDLTARLVPFRYRLRESGQ